MSAATSILADQGPLAFPPFTESRRAHAEVVASHLRRGCEVSDTAFDELYPDAVKRASGVHWTPVRVCVRIVELLRLERGARLLDVGAGAGKFCIVAAAMSGARVRGVERQGALAQIARETARRLDVDVEIAEGTFDTEDPERFDALYLFNPFTETLVLPGLVREVPADRFGRRGAEDVAAAERFLEKARTGARVVTFCGFGGAVPVGYARRALEMWDGGKLELWEKL